MNYQNWGIKNAQLSMDSRRQHDLQRPTSNSNLKLSRSTTAIIPRIYLKFKLNRVPGTWDRVGQRLIVGLELHSCYPRFKIYAKSTSVDPTH